MHYKNGTPAHEGDHVITKDYRGNIRTGVISNLNAQSTTCNCDVSIIHPGGVTVNSCQTIGELWLASDALAAADAALAPNLGLAASVPPATPSTAPNPATPVS